MGFITADIVKQDDDYVWKGEKNLHIYEKNFEEFLISKVSSFSLIIHLVERRIHSESSRMALQL